MFSNFIFPFFSCMSGVILILLLAFLEFWNFALCERKNRYLGLLVFENDFESLQKLYKAFPVGINDSGFYGKHNPARTLLHSAVENKSLECLKIILQQPKVFKLKRDDNGDTALMLALKSKNCRPKMVQTLIESDLRLFDCADSRGQYPIQAAIERNRFDCVKILIDAFVKVEKEPVDYVREVKNVIDCCQKCRNNARIVGRNQTLL